MELKVAEGVGVSGKKGITGHGLLTSYILVFPDW